MTSTLIDESDYGAGKIRFYDGLNFDMIRSHDPMSNDFLVFFIESWADAMRSWRREKLIEDLLDQPDDGFDPREIGKNNIAIYLTGGYAMETFVAIKKKLLEPAPWKHISSIA